jgi:hypothetical protein
LAVLSVWIDKGMSVNLTKTYEITMTKLSVEFVNLETTKPFVERRAALNNVKNMVSLH